jgi:uncharacterized protein YdhG (YjbR/CyaY superfamily)
MMTGKPATIDEYLAGVIAEQRAALEELRGETGSWQTGKGTIRLQPDGPLPAELVRRLLRARVEEGDG